MGVYYYDVQPLGPFAGVEALTGPLYLNDAGVVTATAKMDGGSLGPFHAVKIENGVLTDLTPNASYASGRGSNDATPMQVTGRSDTDNAAVFSNSTTTDVAALLGASASEGTGINDGGVVTGTADGQAFTIDLASNGIAHPLVPQADWCYANAINNVGDVVGRGWFNLDDFWVPAFLWHHSNGLSTLWEPGFFGHEAYDVNDHGVVVGEAKKVNDFYFPFRANGGMEQLAGGAKGSAYGINNKGDVVGRLLSDNQERAFLHIDAEGQDVDLNSRIAPGSGWHLKTAHKINNEGCIVGYGIHNGVDRPFLLKPLENTPWWASLPPRIPMEVLVVFILFGAIQGGPGFGVTPGGNPVPIDPEWLRRLQPGQRDALLGMVLERVAREIQDPKARRRAHRAALDAIKQAVKQMESEIERH